MTAKNTLKTTGKRTLIVYAHPYDGSFNHAVLEAATSALDKAGRPYDVVDLYADGFDPRIQLLHPQDALEAVLAAADMSLANLVRLNVYTTDVDALFPHYGVLAGKLGAAGVAPTTTMLGVTRLAIPGQMVELEGTAVA